MPEWIRNRAKHLLAKNPKMPVAQAWALATQQSHALGKSPKGYGTSEGREAAKDKYDTPKDDKKTANPGELDTPKMAGSPLQKRGFVKSQFSGPLSVGRIPMQSGQGRSSQGHQITVDALAKSAASLKEEAVRGALAGALVEGGLGGAESLQRASHDLPHRASGIPIRAGIGALGGAAASTTGSVLGGLTDSELVGAAGGSVAGMTVPLAANLALRRAGLGRYAEGSPAPWTGLMLGASAAGRSKEGSFGAGISTAMSPMKRLAATRSAAKLDYSAPGKSIAQLAKPKGTGSGFAAAGATKMANTIEMYAALDPERAQREVSQFTPAPVFSLREQLERLLQY